MTPAPLSKVIRTVAGIKRYNPERNRQQVVDIINGVINMLFRTPATRLNYFRIEECAVTGLFQEDCHYGTLSTFLGVVMPCGVTNVTELRVDNVMYEITEKRVAGCPVGALGLAGTLHRNLVTGGRLNRCRPMAEHLRNRFLEKDIPCNSGRIVSFRSDSDKDCGKVVGVRYLDLNATEQREDILLGPAPSSTSVSVRKFLNITFPERAGNIIVETAEGDPLGKYHPSIYVPLHDWFRLQAGCPGMSVSFRGLHTPFDVVFDSDVVPFSDDTIWKLALRAYENLDTMDLSGSETAALNRIYAQISAVTTEDLATNNQNFNDRLMPETSKNMMATARTLSRRT